MADFCKQCSMDMFGEDLGELADLGPAGELGDGEGWSALCEGCGFTVVAQDGTCISTHCEKHGQPKVDT